MNNQLNKGMKNSLVRQGIHLLLIGGMMVMLGTGCSGFHRAWKQELSSKEIYSKSEMKGAWEGEWISDSNGHRGRLRCLVKKNEDGTYTTWYHAKYKKILSFAYSVDVEASILPEGYHFKGKANLGKLAGGMYHYEGNVSDGIFNADYKSKFDYGTFKMNRPLTDK